MMIMEIVLKSLITNGSAFFEEKSLNTFTFKIHIKLGLKILNIGCQLIESQIKLGESKKLVEVFN